MAKLIEESEDSPNGVGIHYYETVVLFTSQEDAA